MTDDVNPKVIYLLRKLMAQADGEKAVGNMAAAEAFAAKAQELLLKHKLEMSDVEFAAEEVNEPVLGEVIIGDDLLEKEYGYDRKRNDRWVGILMNACAHANFCKVLSMRGGKNRMTIVGRASDREVSKALFTYLSNACLEMAPREADMNEAYERIERRTFVTSFKLGFACAISGRLTKKMAELKEGTQQQGLIRIDQMEKATAAKFKELFPKTMNSGSAHASNGMGFRSGTTYGRAIGINSTKRLGA